MTGAEFIKVRVSMPSALKNAYSLFISNYADQDRPSVEVSKQIVSWFILHGWAAKPDAATRGTGVQMLHTWLTSMENSQ